MSVDLDRFSHPLDREGKPPAVFDTCTHCDEDILVGQSVVTYKTDIFCSARCFIAEIGTWTKAGD